MDISNKIDNEIKAFIKSKQDFEINMFQALKKQDKNRIFELLIENGIEDIRFQNKLKYISKQDPGPPINDKTIERLKLHIFKMLK